jgi:hypothetical protein
VEVILALPVHGGREKSLAWHFDKRWVFSVKSAYRVSRDDARRKHTTNGGQGGSASAGKGVWKDLWKLKCPGKIKHFLWRLAHNSHPLRCNLIRRGMQIDISCLVCGRMGEDGAHLFKCKLAKQIWRLLNMDAERVHLAAVPDASGAVEWILSHQEPKRELMVFLLWFLWSERNAIREGVTDRRLS